MSDGPEDSDAPRDSFERSLESSQGTTSESEQTEDTRSFRPVTERTEDAHPPDHESASERTATPPVREQSNERMGGNFSERVDAAQSAIERRTQGLAPEEILEYTTDRRSLSPHVQLQWGLSTSFTIVLLTLVSTAVLANFGVDPRFGTLILVVLFVLGMVWVALRYRKWVYQIRADSIYLERGVVTHRRSLVPYVRIQHVDTSRGPFERALGLSTLVVYTAGSRGADVSIPGLKPEEASDLQQRVKELAIEAEGGDAL